LKKIINDLIQLQELIEVRAQHKAMKPRNHLAQLNKSIDKMQAALPPEAKTIFDKLQKKSQVAIVPIHDGNCTGCGMSLPVSLVYDVKASKEIHQCPTCARILFAAPEGTPMLTSTTAAKYGPRKTGIARYTAPELMIADLEAQDCEEAITKLCQKIKSEGFTKHTDQLIERALERETIISTAVDHGVAFPHVRGVEGGGLTFALGKSDAGIPFDESSDDLTHLVFFIVIPTAASAFYLKLLSGLSEALQNDKNRAKLLEADTADKLWKALTQVTRRTIK